MAANLRLHLMCRPGSALVTQAEGSKLLHRPAFQRLFNIHRKADAVIKPGGDLGVVSLVSRALRALHYIAIARAKLGFTQRSLTGPVILRFQKILIAECCPHHSVAPFVEGQSSGFLVAG